MTDAETGCGLIYDTMIPYTAKQLHRLYGNYENYWRRFEVAKSAAVTQRYLLPEDAGGIDPVASPGDFNAP